MGMFICVRLQDVRECAFGSVNLKCGATVCILQLVLLTHRRKKKSISSLTPQEPNRTCFPDNRGPW